LPRRSAVHGSSRLAFAARTIRNLETERVRFLSGFCPLPVCFLSASFATQGLALVRAMKSRTFSYTLEIGGEKRARLRPVRFFRRAEPP
jgi:hypothetical protein